MSQFLRYIYLQIPQSIRLLFYRSLLTLGSYFYGRGTNGVCNVQRISFNLYIKHGVRSGIRAEARALELVARYTAINAPRVLDVVATARGETYILMTRIPGEVAGAQLGTMTQSQLVRFRDDLGNCIQQLRQIPNPYPHAICSPIGGPLHDFRLTMNNDEPGPFVSEAELNEFVTANVNPIGLQVVAEKISRVHSKKHEIFFAHADLNPGNVLVEDGKLSGIVDWETAGWYPDYWEYTKSRFTVRTFRPWLDTMEQLFPEFGEEFEIERHLWLIGSPF